MSQKNCPICGTPQSSFHKIFRQPLLSSDYRKESISESEIDYEVCSSCGSVTQSVLPSEQDLHDYYSAVCAHGAESVPQETATFFRKRAQDVLNVTGLLGKGSAKVLEVGCANGEFAQLLIERGLEVFGVDPATSSAVATSRGVKMLASAVEQLDPKYHGFFDLVVSLGTFEHLMSPDACFSTLAKFVREGGYIYIDVPDNDYISRGGCNSWGSNFVQIHLHHFTSVGLFKLALHHSFSPVFIEMNNDCNYSSLAMIAVKAAPASYGEKIFLKAAEQEASVYSRLADSIHEHIDGESQVLFWGCGTDLHCLLKTGKIKFTDFKLCDRSQSKIGKSFLGWPICKPEALSVPDVVICMVLDPRVAESIVNDARELFPTARILSAAEMVDIRVAHTIF